MTTDYKHKSSILLAKFNELAGRDEAVPLYLVPISHWTPVLLGLGVDYFIFFTLCVYVGVGVSVGFLR